jgi:hypothetical protein
MRQLGGGVGNFLQVQLIIRRILARNGIIVGTFTVAAVILLHAFQIWVANVLYQSVGASLPKRVRTKANWMSLR